METATANKGFYSLVQYCPDASRAETVNMGVLLFCPDIPFLKTRMTRSNRRIEQLFGAGSVDNQLMSLAKRSLQKRLEAERFKDVRDLEHFVATRANEWRLTSPRPIRVDDPEARLDDLFQDLVEVDAGEMLVAPARTMSVLRHFRNLIMRPSLRGRVQRRVKVTLPNTTREIEVPFAYRNGALNLLQPKAFPSGSKGVDLALRLACEGDLLQRHPDEDGNSRKFIVIPYLENDSDLRQNVESIFGEYRIRTVRPDSLEEFVAEVDREAHT